jgi:hypothetical protein
MIFCNINFVNINIFKKHILAPISHNEAMMKRNAEAGIRATFGCQAVW